VSLSLDPSGASTASAVDRIAQALYGPDVSRPAGVLHVTSVSEDGGRLRVIRIGEQAPASPLDFFVLNLARARADAIVVSGAVLRAEPELRYDLQGPDASARGLVAWRRERAGLDAPPRLLVLTRGDLPLDHPALRSWARPLVYTSRDAAGRLAGTGLPVVGVDAPSLGGALQHLTRVCGARSIAIEAGPTATRELYASGSTPVRELWLSVFEGTLDPRARAGLLATPAALAAAGLARRSALRAEQPSGPWRFERWVAMA
jgi:riboflavin biosynthesis pyrimidine reductase